MLANGKTSQPIAKSFDKEILVKVKLDFNRRHAFQTK